LEEPESGGHASVPLPGGPCRVEEGAGPEDVRAEEELGVLDRAVNVGLGREVDDGIDRVLRNERVCERAVADVSPHEGEPLPLFPSKRRDVLEVPCIRERVEAYDGYLRVGPEDVVYEVAADEPGDPGDKDMRH